MFENPKTQQRRRRIWDSHLVENNYQHRSVIEYSPSVKIERFHLLVPLSKYYPKPSETTEPEPYGISVIMLKQKKTEWSRDRVAIIALTLSLAHSIIPEV